MKNNYTARSVKTLALAAVFALPSLVQAHPGVAGHTHALTSVMSDAQAAVVVVVAVGFVAVAVWRSLRGSAK